MKMTLQVTLNSGVKITTSREVKTFVDVGMFGRKVVDWVNQIKKIAPDLAADTVDVAHILMDESTTPLKPARKRNRNRKGRTEQTPEQAAMVSGGDVR